MESAQINIPSLKELAARKKSVIRVFGKLDVHFLSINPEGEVYSAAMEIIPEGNVEAFLADVLTHAEKFQVEGRFWKRELSRSGLQRLLKRDIKPSSS